MHLLQKLLVCLCVLNLAVSESWWQTGVIYQIYPRSFQDSDGNGVGDLNGITQRLDYLHDIGVSAIWLSPIYKSPMADFGYDIANFKEIDPIFGTLDDFKDLKKNCTARGIKLILDFVPNHSSDENEWFTKSVAKEGNYTDYYIWEDPIRNETTNETAPNNWISVFGGPAWEWNENRQQYYLHQFLAKQPDLNYRDENLVREMMDVQKFWMDLGVDGFRVDAIPYLFENVTLPNEPWSGDINATPNDTNYLTHIYTQNQPETYDMVHKWRVQMDEISAADNQDRVMMLEAYASIKQVMKYYGTKEKPGAHFPFNFLLITDLNSNSNATDFDSAIHRWLDNMPEGSQANWVIGNHDNHRVASRYGSDLVDGMNMLDLLLPGTAITYYGEEIGMVDTYIPPEEVVDMSGRDPERTPMQWDNSTNAGFSSSNKTWLRVNENYHDLNVENQLATNKSHLFVYKSLVQLRKSSEIIKKGKISTSALSKNVFSFERYLDNNKISYVVLINLGAENTTTQAPESQKAGKQTYTVYTASINSALQFEDKVTFPLQLGPKEALVLEAKSKAARAIAAGIFLTIATSLVALLFHH